MDKLFWISRPVEALLLLPMVFRVIQTMIILIYIGWMFQDSATWIDSPNKRVINVSIISQE